MEASYRSLDGFRLIFFIPYDKETRPLSLCMSVCTLLTASKTVKLSIGPEMGLGHFICIPYIKATYLCLYVCLSVCLFAPKDLANC